MPVHPRACGEHWPALSLEKQASGSSPRVRGTHIIHQQEIEPPRFIPARAGNTQSLVATAAA